MPLDPKFLYEPRTMIRALAQGAAPKRYFLKTFFGKSMTFTTTSVDMDVMKTKRRVAGYTGPSATAKVVERESFYTVTVSPAYIKEMVPTRFADLLKRQMGETIYDPLSPDIRAATLLGNDLRMLDERITRREELMCAQALFDGRIDIRGEGINHVVDFGYIDNVHRKILSGGSLWDAATGDPMKDVDDWRGEINERCGVLPDRFIVGKKVAWAIINNPKVKERLDTRRYEMGQIKPEDLGEGVRYIGTLMPSMLDILVYDEVYTDPADGKSKPLVPEDSILLGSTQAGCVMLYGVIQNLKGPYAVPRFPLVWEKEDGSARFLQMESAPLPNLYQADAFMTAKVLG